MSNNDGWYSKALEVLNPLRYHLQRIIDDIEAHNQFCESYNKLDAPSKQSPIPINKVAEAKVALEEAETFFTKGA